MNIKIEIDGKEFELVDKVTNERFMYYSCMGLKVFKKLIMELSHNNYKIGDGINVVPVSYALESGVYLSFEFLIPNTTKIRASLGYVKIPSYVYYREADLLLGLIQKDIGGLN